MAAVFAGLATWPLASSRVEGAPTASVPSGLVAFLPIPGALSDGELVALARGEIVAKTIETSDRSEILSFAAMRVSTTPAKVLQRFTSVFSVPHEPWVLQVGQVGPVPSPHALDAVALDGGEVKALSRCRVNDCDIRLSAQAIERFRREIDWSSPQRAARANALFREVLAASIAAYLARGNAALFEYANNDEPVRVGDSLQRVIIESGFVGQIAPAVFAYLQRFPSDRPPDATDVLFWVKEKFWLLNVLSLNHSTIVDRTVGPRRIVMAVTKQLYATHYFESSLGVTAYVEVVGEGGYLVTVNRTRADIRPSGFSLIERLLVNRLVRHRLDAQFQFLRETLQAPSA